MGQRKRGQWRGGRRSVLKRWTGGKMNTGTSALGMADLYLNKDLAHETNMKLRGRNVPLGMPGVPPERKLVKDTKQAMHDHERNAHPDFRKVNPVWPIVKYAPPKVNPWQQIFVLGADEFHRIEIYKGRRSVLSLYFHGHFFFFTQFNFRTKMLLRSLVYGSRKRAYEVWEERSIGWVEEECHGDWCM